MHMLQPHDMAELVQDHRGGIRGPVRLAEVLGDLRGVEFQAAGDKALGPVAES